MFGSDHWGVDPDLWVCAKGLAAGDRPLAMVGMNREIASAFAGAQRRASSTRTRLRGPCGGERRRAGRPPPSIRAPGFVEAIAAEGEALREEALDAARRGARCARGARAGMLLGDSGRDALTRPSTRHGVVRHAVARAAEARGLMLNAPADPTGFGHDKLILFAPVRDREPRATLSSSASSSALARRPTPDSPRLSRAPRRVGPL